MASPKSREQRQVVFLNARLRTDDGWSNVTICNVSPRGLMGKSADPPARGAFVEVHRGGVCVVGHVRWSQGSRFGIRSQCSIDVAALVSEQPGKRRTPRAMHHAPTHAATPVQPAASIAAKAERNRDLGRLLEWAAIVFAAVGFAWLLADQVGAALFSPMQEVRTAMSSHR